jgi:membrane protein implicated in regulation of membrane protease activity
VPELGKLLIIVGGLVVVVGLFLTLGLRIPFLGKLPGDISIDRGNVHFYFPIVTSLLLSVVLTLLLNLFFRNR